jgi:para-aminobenzoate synthetase/4-amino-4-deoxychorismate lyase
MPIRCEINFPLLPTLSEDERQVLSFEQPVALHVAYTLGDVLPTLRKVSDAAARGHWLVGFVAHEAAPAFDRALTVGGATTPLVWFAEFSTAHAPHATPERDNFQVGPWQSDTSSTQFAEAVQSIRADIREGRFYQVNYTTRLSAPFSGKAAHFYRALEAAQPRGYHVFIDTDDWQLLSVSPELFFSLRDGVVTTQPMKGTAPRGDTPEADTEFAQVLTHSPKERAENLMIVDLLRNDLSRIAHLGSVEVPHLFSLHALPSVWQMTSTVRATLRNGVRLPDVFQALFPCGSVTGAPKVEAMRAIADLEAMPRGAYCGAIGVVAPGGAATFNVGIRSVWIQHGVATCGVGSGITHDSTVEGEADELVYKARFVRRASKPFSLFETLRLEDGNYWLLARHLARMARSARHFRFAFDEDAARKALNAIASTKSRGVWRVKLTSAPDGACEATCHALDATPDTPTIMLAASAVSASDEFLQHKTTRRETYDAHTPPAGVWDTLLWNERGELTEFLRANLVIDRDGARLTPALASGLLDGTLRREWLDAGKIEEALLTPADLHTADAIWWVNGLRGAVRVQLMRT